MRYALDHKQQTRTRVLQAATRQMRERGPHGVALGSVMAEVGLTHGTFYAHFQSKEDFLGAAVEVMFDESPADLLRGRPGRSPRETLCEFVDYYLSTSHRDTRSAGCPLPFLVADAPRLSQHLRDRLARGIRSMVEQVSKHLADLGHGSPADEASCAISEMIGAVILARAEPDPVRSGEILARARRSVWGRFGLEAP